MLDYFWIPVLHSRSAPTPRGDVELRGEANEQVVLLHVGWQADVESLLADLPCQPDVAAELPMDQNVRPSLDVVKRLRIWDVGQGRFDLLRKLLKSLFIGRERVPPIAVGFCLVQKAVPE